MGNQVGKAAATREAIIRAAMELFFEKGYENTSIRMITARAGLEVGSFYYHFAAKENVLEAAINLFFERYERQMREVVEKGKQSSRHILTDYVDYIDRAVQSFRAQYLRTLHWSILAAIREHTIKTMAHYIGEILQYYVVIGTIEAPCGGVGTTADMVAASVGFSVLYRSEEDYRSRREAVLRIIPLLTDAQL